MREVDAVKTDSQLSQLDAQLRNEDGSPSVYFDIWKFGVNVALRIGDLLNLTTDQIKESINMDKPVLVIQEAKTNKTRKIALNNPALEVAKRRLQENPNHKFLFQSTKDTSKRATPKPINRKTVSRVFAIAGANIRPSVRLGTHSMRKTRGYALHASGEPIEVVTKMLNHASPAVTMRYIGVDQANVDDTFYKLEL